MKTFIYILLFLYNINAIAGDKVVCINSEKYEESLRNISTMRTDFTQNINGKFDSSGFFLLKRPGKMLVDYNHGSVDAIIGVNGKIITYLNRETEQISHIPKSKTPVHFILDNTKKFSELNLLKCEEIGDNFIVRFKQENETVSGTFALFFDKNTAELTRIATINSGGDEIELIFANTKLNVDIPDRNFTIKDPRL